MDPIVPRWQDNILWFEIIHLWNSDYNAIAGLSYESKRRPLTVICEDLCGLSLPEWRWLCFFDHTHDNSFIKITDDKRRRDANSATSCVVRYLNDFLAFPCTTVTVALMACQIFLPNISITFFIRHSYWLTCMVQHNKWWYHVAPFTNMV